jgi:hypothetical protein
VGNTTPPHPTLLFPRSSGGGGEGGKNLEEVSPSHISQLDISTAHRSDPFRPSGENRAEIKDRVIEKDAVESEEHVEEIFGQLWAIPNSEAARVPHPGYGSMLVWIRKDLVRERRIRLEDCFPVSRSHRIDKPPTRLYWAMDIWSGGSGKETYAEILKKTMEEGGRWVWHPDRPVHGRAPSRG